MNTFSMPFLHICFTCFYTHRSKRRSYCWNCSCCCGRSVYNGHGWFSILVYKYWSRTFRLWSISCGCCSCSTRVPVSPLQQLSVETLRGGYKCKFLLMVYISDVQSEASLSRKCEPECVTPTRIVQNWERKPQHEKPYCRR